jgi:hypothetical protein
MVSANDHKVNIFVRKEVIRSPIMLCVWKINSAVLARLDLAFWSFGPLQERIHIQVWVRDDEGEIEAFGGEAIAHDSNIDRRHDCLVEGLKSKLGKEDLATRRIYMRPKSDRRHIRGVMDENLG